MSIESFDVKLNSGDIHVKVIGDWQMVRVSDTEVKNHFSVFIEMADGERCDYINTGLQRGNFTIDLIKNNIHNTSIVLYRLKKKVVFKNANFLSGGCCELTFGLQ